jgi:glycyl-tRNA synthetase alpha subunit
MEVGAGTSHTATFLRAIGPELRAWLRSADPGARA